MGRVEGWKEADSWVQLRDGEKVSWKKRKESGRKQEDGERVSTHGRMREVEREGLILGLGPEKASARQARHRRGW